MIINIQPSIIIWTVVCFTVFMMILKNWLFRPVLKVLDQRRNKLEAARAKKEEFARIEEEQQKELESKRSEHKKALEKAAKDEVANIQANEKNELKLAHAKSLENIDRYRAELESNHAQIVDALSPKMKEVAEIFAKQITSYRT